MNQMRELFEKWATDNGLSIKLRDDASSPDTYFAYETEQRWIVWQAAQSASVPVVRDVVAWVRLHPDGALSSEFIADDIIEPIRRNSGAWLPMIIQPATSISAAELERLQQNTIELEFIRRKFAGMKASTSEQFLWALGVAPELCNAQSLQEIIAGELKNANSSNS